MPLIFPWCAWAITVHGLPDAECTDARQRKLDPWGQGAPCQQAVVGAAWGERVVDTADGGVAPEGVLHPWRDVHVGSGGNIDRLVLQVNTRSPSSTKNASSSLSCSCGGATTPGGQGSSNVTDRPAEVKLVPKSGQ
jgi:hypothetical protein